MTIERALAAPRHHDLLPAHELSVMVSKGGSLWPSQVEALRVLNAVRPPVGGFFPMAVGAGKFLVSVLAATVTVPRPERPVLVVPPSLEAQTLAEIERWSPHFRIHPNLKVIKYSTLSALKHKGMLLDLEPDLLIFDEAHLLRNPSSRRTREVSRYLAAAPDCRVVVMSGTFGGTAIKDWSHLACAALVEGSPVPTHYPDIEAWDSVIGVGADAREGNTNAVLPLLRAQGFDGTDASALQQNARTALWEHVRGTHGVYYYQGSSCSSKLDVSMRTYELQPVTEEHLRTLAKLWQLPDDDLVESPAHVAVCRQHLMQGFYYHAVWEDESVRGLYREAKAQWASYVRGQVRRGKVDTELEVVQGLTDPSEGLMLYKQWLKFKPHTPRMVPVWLDDGLVDYVCDILDGGSKTIVWLESVPLQQRMKELRPTQVFVAGEAVDTEPGRPVALSIKSHGTGLNLQAWDTNVLTYTPPNATIFEQLLGRTHRHGQLSPVVKVELLAPKNLTWPVRRATDIIREGAEYQDPYGDSRTRQATWRV